MTVTLIHPGVVGLPVSIGLQVNDRRNFLEQALHLHTFTDHMKLSKKSQTSITRI